MSGGDNIVKVAELISAQIDQLWSLGMAIIVAEIVIACSFFRGDRTSCRHRTAEVLLYGTIVLHAVSLFFGYLAKGGLVELVQTAAGAARDQSYKSVEVASLAQFFFLVGGVLVFVLVFALNRDHVTEAILKKK